MIVGFSILFVCWEFIIKHPGILLVLLGVIGEVIFDWKEMRGRLAWAKRLSAVILIVGLIMEFWEAARSDREVSTAIERAGIAEKKAGEANERAANTESNNLVLQARVETLQARRISINQEKKFLNYLNHYPTKTPVKVFVGQRDGETDDYASEIRKILDEAGFGSGKSNDIIELGDVRTPSSIGQTVEDYPFSVEVYATNNNPSTMGLPGVTFIQSNGITVTHFVYYSNDVRSVFGIVNLAFHNIGIEPAFHGNNVYLKPGEWGIFIPKKF